MKRIVPLFGLFAFLAPMALFAQGGDAPIKVTSTVHSDGTQTVLKTDPDARTAESTLLDTAQKVVQRTVYTLDDQGQFATASIFDDKGKLLFKSTYVRDAHNQLTEQLDSSPDDKPLRKLTFEYNGYGKLIRVRTFDPAGNETTPAKKPSKAPTRHP
jgi:hypothetical protein